MVIANGKFHFDGSLAGTDPVNAFLVLNIKGTGPNTDDYKSIYLENGVITVSSPDSLNNAKVEGTKTNLEKSEYDLALKPVNAAYDSLEKVQNAATPAQQQSEDFAKQQ